MLTIQQEPVSRWIREGADLFADHWRELRTEAERSVIPLHVDFARYAKLEADNALVAWTARDGDGKLTGYNVFFLSRHPHYASTVFAQNDVIFLAAAHRKGMAGVRLIKAANAGLKAMGVRKVIYHAKLGTAFERVLPALGLRAVETTYEGVL